MEGKQCSPITNHTIDAINHRVCHQVKEWIGNDLPAEKWGWVEAGRKYVPLMMTRTPPPPYLLEIVRGGCKENGYKPGVSKTWNYLFAVMRNLYSVVFSIVPESLFCTSILSNFCVSD